MKTCKETKSCLHFWLKVWMLEEETFISYETDASRLKCLAATTQPFWLCCLLLWAMDGCTEVLEKSLEVENTEYEFKNNKEGGNNNLKNLNPVEGCSHQSITASTHGDQVAVLSFALSVLSS